jgi:hypothetical protein
MAGLEIRPNAFMYRIDFARAATDFRFFFLL